MSRTSAVAVTALLAVAALLVSGCGATDEGSASRLVASEEFAAIVARPGVVTINVHVPDEGSIRGTDLWIPFDAVEARRAELPPPTGPLAAPPPTGPLAVYCRSGRMSAIAVETLLRLGYEDVVELDGGMVAWERGGGQLLPARGP